MVGASSSGKSKIGTYVANVIGTSNKPIIGYRSNDILALNNWFVSGSDVMVFDDFSFTSATDRHQPSKVFEELKSWTSGIAIQPRVALNTKRRTEHLGVTVKAVIISVNEIKPETSRIVEAMPEFVDRLEVIYLYIFIL